MSLRFQPDPADSSALPVPELVDPEAPDASEQEFSASLEEPTPRFVVDEEVAAETEPEAAAPIGGTLPAEGQLEDGPVGPAQPILLGGSEPDPDAWRQEVSARVSNYRAKRKPHVPRYPSLQLRFDPPLPIADRPPMPTASRHSMAVESVAAPIDAEEPTAPPAPAARILEFPRSVIVPPRPLDELAEPVLDRPRILEAPELVPPPPALGGMLIEAPEQPPVDDRRPGIDVPLRSASMSRRLAATAIDGLLVLAALALFGYVFFRMTEFMQPSRAIVAMALALAGIFWAGYQYLLLVYTGTTPGLRLARLKLERFDGSSVPRKLRRWRVFASVLSGLSLGLGYAWSALDEDALCWHDRATHTYMAPNPR